jgi:hypothetical protein
MIGFRVEASAIAPAAAMVSNKAVASKANTQSVNIGSARACTVPFVCSALAGVATSGTQENRPRATRAIPSPAVMSPTASANRR